MPSYVNRNSQTILISSFSGSTGSTGRIRPQQPPQTPSLPPPVPQNPSSRPQRPRRLLDPSVPVRAPPSTSSSLSSGPPSSATPPALPFQPAAPPAPIANLSEEPVTATSTRQYVANRPRLRHHNRRKSCLRRPLGCELGCAGACLPGWETLRSLVAAALAGVMCYACLVFINAYLGYIYNVSVHIGVTLPFDYPHSIFFRSFFFRRRQ